MGGDELGFRVRGIQVIEMKNKKIGIIATSVVVLLGLALIVWYLYSVGIHTKTIREQDTAWSESMSNTTGLSCVCDFSYARCSCLNHTHKCVVRIQKSGYYLMGSCWDRI